jgi:hypothetical protein
MTGTAPRRLDTGTSLVEALVAMAVMAFGMLAVVGVQATLRLNADIAKQRSEAVRIAQQAMEAARSFAVVDTTPGRAAYADIANFTDQVVVAANTTFLLSRNVAARSRPDRKDVSVVVEWDDRNGARQQVALASVIGANDPAASLALVARPNGIPERLPLGRHPAIPPRAVTVGEGLSGFKPPGGSGGGNVVWVFNNTTGLIVGVCNGVSTPQDSLTAADVAGCSDNTVAQPLSGFVRFATDALQPTAEVAENPSSTALNLAINVALGSTGHPMPDHSCYAAAPMSAATTDTVVPYYCAIFSNVARVWSGTSTVAPLAFSEVGQVAWEIALDAADAAATRYRVCRYTPATSDAQPVPNREHPRQYSNVTALEPLRDQNFLVIRAGNGTSAFTCPTDGAANPATGDLVNSNTLVHQPAP